MIPAAMPRRRHQGKSPLLFGVSPAGAVVEDTPLEVKVAAALVPVVLLADSATVFSSSPAIVATSAGGRALSSSSYDTPLRREVADAAAALLAATFSAAEGDFQANASPPPPCSFQVSMEPSMLATEAALVTLGLGTIASPI